MKKRKLILIATAVIAIVVTGVRIKSSKIDKNLTDLQLKNVEALVNEEQDCHNTNGYRKWKTNKPWPWSDQMGFKDCCMVDRTGYSPKEDCH